MERWEQNIEHFEIAHLKPLKSLAKVTKYYIYSIIDVVYIYDPFRHYFNLFYRSGTVPLVSPVPVAKKFLKAQVFCGFSTCQSIKKIFFQQESTINQHFFFFP